jgi:hypothetical protein
MNRRRSRCSIRDPRRDAWRRSEYRSLGLFCSQRGADDAQSRFLEPSTFNQKPYAAAPAVWRSSPSSAAPRRASADIVAERCDAAIRPESGEKPKRAACARNDVNDPTAALGRHPNRPRLKHNPNPFARLSL